MRHAPYQLQLVYQLCHCLLRSAQQQQHLQKTHMTQPINQSINYTFF
jgi:hypothetical protein